MASTGSKRLVGKVAVVTASTDGIGFAIAKRLAQEGAMVMISSRHREHVDKALQILKNENLDVIGMVCHVGKKLDRQAMIKEAVMKCGGIDILVSNAAVSTFFGPPLFTPEEAYDKMFDTNVKSSFMLCQEVYPEMEKRGGGSIILVSSIGGFTPLPIVGVYSMTKTALFGMCKTLAPQLAASNIRINTIAPGLIDTKFSAAVTSDPEGKEMALAAIPLGRFGMPEDCSGAAAFLASNDSSFITGETIVMAGGQTSRL